MVAGNSGCGASTSVRTKLNYCLPNPYGIPHRAVPIRPNSMTMQSNYINDAREVLIQDVRGRENTFSLDTNGFEFVVHQTNETFQDDNSIKTNYYSEVKQLIKDVTGAHQVFIVAHRTRQGYDNDSTTDVSLRSERQPAFIVHTDRSAESVTNEVKKYLGTDGERLLHGRVRFLNVWRPIGDVAHHEPLAVADWQTSSDVSKLFALTMSGDNSTDKGFDVLLSRFSPNHSWYYLRHQDPSEVLMLKFYDNNTHGASKFCLHSAFLDAQCHPDTPRRRSIEVSALVFG
ncbi:unnamed protein product [Rhizoctonia solani]|uniref:Methyltransferase n=1 Tax=Rhizoctonia solani TaxID=456999 RepID=A0A8H3DWM0_9AGAM|nr:unnamed protein product [Rhizoctonia solani]